MVQASVGWVDRLGTVSLGLSAQWEWTHFWCEAHASSIRTSIVLLYVSLEDISMTRGPTSTRL